MLGKVLARRFYLEKCAPIILLEANELVIQMALYISLS